MSRSPLAARAAGRPRYLQFYPTLRCRLSCGFCFNRGLETVPDIPLEHFARLARCAAREGIGRLDFLGGEPTLHPGLPEMTALLRAQGLRATLSTSGRGDLGLLESLLDADPSGAVRIGVSWNGGRLPRRLAEFIRRRRPMLKGVCTRGWRLPGVAREHLGHPGAEYFLLFMDAITRDDLGRGVTFPRYLETLRRLRREFPRAQGVHCGFLMETASSPELARVRCPAGTTKLSVLPDGSVYPCYLLFRHREFRLGNLLEDGFEAIWESPVLAFFRSFRGNPCPRRGCRLHAACHGGCPAVSLLVSGDLCAPDPRCGS